MQHSYKMCQPLNIKDMIQRRTANHSVGIYSETTHNLPTVVSARPAPAASFYNPRMPISACAVQYAFDAFINSEFGSRLNMATKRESEINRKFRDNNICIVLY